MKDLLDSRVPSNRFNVTVKSEFLASTNFSTKNYQRAFATSIFHQFVMCDFSKKN